MATDHLLQNLQADLFLHSPVIGAQTEKNWICALNCVDDEGMFEIRAKAFVGCIGDANPGTAWPEQKVMWGMRKDGFRQPPSRSG